MLVELEAVAVVCGRGRVELLAELVGLVGDFSEAPLELFVVVVEERTLLAQAVDGLQVFLDAFFEEAGFLLGVGGCYSRLCEPKESWECNTLRLFLTLKFDLQTHILFLQPHKLRLDVIHVLPMEC